MVNELFIFCDFFDLFIMIFAFLKKLKNVF
nr:MAG TPA: hypothetical protein [Caudoviricetes sp.]